MVKVVCFDIGGVMVRITQRWHEAARYAGVAISQDLPLDAHLLDAPTFDAYQANEVGEDNYLPDLAAYLGGISVEDARRVHNYIIIEPYQGIDSIVDSLNEAGIVTACLSNTNEPHWLHMNGSGLFPANERLQVRMASHELGVQKPDPKIFRLFEERVEAKGSEIVFFDDSTTNIKAARDLGWRAEAIDPAQETAPQIAAVLEQCGISLKLSPIG